jgi:hypothetical protein
MRGGRPAVEGLVASNMKKTVVDSWTDENVVILWLGS